MSNLRLIIARILVFLIPTDLMRITLSEIAKDLYSYKIITFIKVKKGSRRYHLELVESPTAPTYLNRLKRHSN